MSIDLHTHSRASDGTDAPAALVEKAAALHLRAVSLTDHDTVAGVAEALSAGARLGVEVVPGIEVSSDYRDNNVHVLGYFIDPASPALTPVLDWVRVERELRNEKLAAMLAADGFDITMEQLRREYPGAALGRPHMAEHLVRRGYAASVREAFEKYLGEDRPYFLPKRRIPMARAIRVIAEAGGVPVLAHPFQYRYPRDQVTEMIEYARTMGVRGLECYYSEHSPDQQAWLLAQAERYGLGVSGGSDYHGSRKTHIVLGALAVPDRVLDDLRALHHPPGKEDSL